MKWKPLVTCVACVVGFAMLSSAVGGEERVQRASPADDKPVVSVAVSNLDNAVVPVSQRRYYSYRRVPPRYYYGSPSYRYYYRTPYYGRYYRAFPGPYYRVYPSPYYRGRPYYGPYRGRSFYYRGPGLYFGFSF